EVAQKLPEVLSQGLARLYHFQHGDGGWGWWEHDATNLGMTTYVVAGLARCRSTGTAVDEDVLRHGCDFLTAALGEGKLEEPLASEAWLALALAGRADAAGLKTAAARAEKQGSTEVRCRLALACRTARLKEPGERLWALACRWKAEGTEALALYLLTR